MGAKSPRPGKNARKGTPAKLQLSPGQQAALWPMLAEAWAAHVCREQVADTSSNGKDAWRKQYLGSKMGIWSLKMIPKGGLTFCRVMAALQEVARNGIDWIVKAGQASPADLIYHARAVLGEHDIPEAYACGIARNAFHFDALPALHDLSEEQLATTIRIVYAQGPRIATAARKSQAVEGVPF